MNTEIENNKQPRNVLRVEIAQDVIDRVKLKQFVPIKDFIFGQDTREILCQYEGGNKDFLGKGKINKCYICAKGGMLLSFVNRFNGCHLFDLSGIGNTNNESVSKKMDQLFSEKEIDEIEMLYEGYYCGNVLENTEQDFLKTKIGKLKESKDVRLIQIMQIIIDNKGEKIYL